MATKAITISMHHCQFLAFQPHGVFVPKLDAVVALARDLNIPTEVCDLEFVNALALDEIVQKLGEPTPYDPRKILLIFGAFLEEQISLAVHFKLVTGFDVYISRDRVLSKNLEHTEIHDRRLVQAGAVSTTLQQLVYEWMATESDENIRHILKQASQI